MNTLSHLNTKSNERLPLQSTKTQLDSTPMSCRKHSSTLQNQLLQTQSTIRLDKASQDANRASFQFSQRALRNAGFSFIFDHQPSQSLLPLSLFDSEYIIRQRLKASKQCQVVKCYHIPTQEFRLAKIYNNTDYKDIEKEILVNQRLQQFPHQNILQLMQVYSEDQKYIFVYEFLEGGTLFDYLRSKSFQIPINEAKKIMKKLLKVLFHLHSHSIMHRDIKLDNIMFKKNNDIKSLKIIDFGFSTFTDDENLNQQRCGTPGYIAPEIFTTQNYSELCDIYSLGAVFHIILTGSRIFPQDITLQQLYSLNAQNSYLISDRLKNQQLRDLIIKMLATNKRINAKQCLNHDFFYQDPPSIQDEISLNDKINNLQFPKFKNPFFKK